MPLLPTGWTSQVTGASPLWVTSNTFSNTTPNSAFINGPGAISDASLFSPTFILPGQLISFQHRYALENNFDGGVLEIKVENGAFTDVLSAGGTFVTGGYNGSVGGSNPIAGRNAWTGSRNTFFETKLSLPANLVGRSVTLRWRRTTDSSVSSVGWYVDSVKTLANADLSVTMTDSVDPFVAGTRFFYTVRVHNNGPEIATNTTVFDVFPRNMFLSLTDSTISQGGIEFQNDAILAKFGSIPPGGDVTAQLAVNSINVLSDPIVLSVTSPAGIARDYQVEVQAFGATTTANPISAQLILVNDAVGNSFDGCEVLTNGSAISGNIALIASTTNCQVDLAAQKAQLAGARAVVILDPNYSHADTSINGNNVTIPVVRIANLDANPILNALGMNPVNATLAMSPGRVLNSAQVISSAVDTASANDFALEYTAYLNDRDSDGIPDVQDLCPDIKSTNQNDLDSDGIGDVCDTCTDSDHDGAGNPDFLINTCQLDACSTDSAKIFPGVCGCGVSDKNSDGDSLADCQDLCPNDGNKTELGVCGCGVRDIDANSNGIIDCKIESETKVILTQIKSLVGGLTVVPTSNAKKAARQKKYRSDIKRLAKLLQSYVASNNVQLVNTNSTAGALSKSTADLLNKLVKSDSKTFGKNKKAASKALIAFLGNVAG